MLEIAEDRHVGVRQDRQGVLGPGLPVRLRHAVRLVQGHAVGSVKPGHTDPKLNGNPTEVRWFKWAKTAQTAKLTMRHATAEPTARCQNLKRLAAGDKFKPDGWEKILKFDGGTAVSNVTIIESTDKDHELMVKPQLLKQLTGQP